MTPEQIEARRKYQREWARENYRRNKARVCANSKRYYDAHKDECKERHAKWLKDNAEHVKAYAKERYWSDPEFFREQAKKFPERAREYQRKRRVVNGDHVRAMVRAVKRSNPERTIWNYVKAFSKRHNLPFDLDVEDIVIPSHCPVFGFELKQGVGKRTDASPSIDRIIPERGYTKGNILIVSWKANRFKNNATVAEMRQLADFYTKITGA